MPKVKWSAKSIPGTCIVVGKKRTQYTFDGVRGLILDCLPSGQRNWVVRYQVWIGSKRIERKCKLGTFAPEKSRGHTRAEMPDVLTPGEARDLSQRILSQVRDGHDPWLEKQRKEEKTAEAVTLSDAFQAFLDDPRTDRRPTTVEGYEGLYQRHIHQKLGSCALQSLTREIIEHAVISIRESSTNSSRGYRGLQSTKALTLIHAILEFSIRKRWISANPARQVEDPVPKKNPKGKAHRPMNEEELRLAWAEAPKHFTEQTLRAFRLALLLGRRVSELIGARKEELSLEHRRWLVAKRTGNKSKYIALVTLPPLAMQLITEAMTASKDSDFVFASERSKTGHMARQTPSKAFTNFRRVVGIGEQVRFHDARGLMNDGMAQMKVPSEYRSHVFHHTADIKSALVEETYSAYDFEDEKRQALELWEMRLSDIVSGKPLRLLRWDNHWMPTNQINDHAASAKGKSS